VSLSLSRFEREGLLQRRADGTCLVLDPGALSVIR
jgi:hypothetical protein